MAKFFGAHKTMRDAIIFAVVLALGFFLFPIVPYSTSATGSLDTRINAQISLSYAVFQCGIVMNPQFVNPDGSAIFGAIPPWTGPRLICGSTIIEGGP